MGMVSHYTSRGIVFNYYTVNWNINKDMNMIKYKLKVAGSILLLFLILTACYVTFDVY